MSIYTYKQISIAVDRAEKAAETFLGVSSSQSDYVPAEVSSIKTLAHRITDHLRAEAFVYEGDDGLSITGFRIEDRDVIVDYSNGTTINYSTTFSDIIPEDPISITNYITSPSGELIESDSAGDDSNKGTVVGLDGGGFVNLVLTEDGPNRGKLFVEYDNGTTQYVGDLTVLDDGIGITGASILGDNLYVELNGSLELVGIVSGEKGDSGVMVQSISIDRRGPEDFHVMVSLDNGYVFDAGKTLVSLRPMEDSDALQLVYDSGVHTFVFPNGTSSDLRIDGVDGVDGVDGAAIESATITVDESGKRLLFVDFTKVSDVLLGEVPSVVVPPITAIDSHTITSSNELIITFKSSDADININCGQVRGADGVDGRTITDITINPLNEVEVTLDDNGVVSTSVIGYIGFDSITGVYKNDNGYLVLEREYGDDLISDGKIDGYDGVNATVSPNLDSANEMMLSLRLHDGTVIEEIGKLRPLKDHSVTVDGMDLVITFDDGQSEVLGRVRGFDGRNLVDVQLHDGQVLLEYEDDVFEVAEPVRAFVAVEYDGDLITFTRDDGTEVPFDYTRMADGVHGRWITDMYFDATTDELRIKYNDQDHTSADNLGLINGDWITEIVKNGEVVSVVWQSDPTTQVKIGELRGIDGLHGRWPTAMNINADGNLDVEWSDAIVDDLGRAHGRWITNIRRDGDDFYVQYNNEPTETHVGSFESFDGKDPQFIESLRITSNRDLEVKFDTEADPRNLGGVDGFDAVWITSMDIDGNRHLEIEMSDGSKRDIGLIDFRSKIENVFEDDGIIKVERTDGVTDGGLVIRRVTGSTIEDSTLTLHTRTGDIAVGYVAGSDYDDGVYIKAIRIDSFQLAVEMSDGWIIDAGEFLRNDIIDVALVSGGNDLQFWLTDGTFVNVGQVKGRDGEVNIVDGFVNNDGILVLTRDKGLSPLDVGHVYGDAGVGIVDITVNSDGHIIATLEDGSESDGGFVLTDFGFAPHDTLRVYNRGESCTRNGRVFVAMVDGVSVAPSTSTPEWGLVRFATDPSPDVGRPEPKSPVAGSAHSGLRPFLIGDSFRNYFSVDTRLFREFQIDEVGGLFDDPLYSAMENRDGHQVEMELDPTKEYIWRIRDVVRETGQTSNWSVNGRFTVEAGNVEHPVISAGSGYDMEAMQSPAGFESSIFSGQGTHLTTTWQIRDLTRDEIVFEDVESDDRYGIIVPFGILRENRDYDVRCKYHGDVVDSAWSDWTRFKTVSQFALNFKPAVKYTGEDINATVARPVFESNSTLPTFFDEYMEGRNLTARWELYQGEELIWETENQVMIVTAQILPQLPSGETYQIRVQYSSPRFSSPSEWSELLAFTVSWEIQTPATSYLGPDATSVFMDSMFGTSEFIGFNDSHFGTEWELVDPETNERLQRGVVTRNVQEIPVSFTSRDSGMTYQIRTRHLGRFAASDWSEWIVFTVEEIQAPSVYTTSTDNTIRKVSADGIEEWVYTGNSHSCYSVAVDLDGFVYSGASSTSGTTKFDQDMNLIWRNSIGSNIYGIDVDMFGGTYHASSDGVVRKFDANGDVVWSYSGGGSTMWDVSVSSDGKYVYCVGTGRRLDRLDGETGERLWGTMAFSNDLYAVSMDTAGFTYAAGNSNSNANGVKKFDERGTELWTFSDYTGQVYALDVSDDGNWVAFGAGSNNVHLLNAETGEEVWRVPISGIAYGVTFDSDGFIYVGNSTTNTLHKLDMTGEEMWVYEGHTNSVRRITSSRHPKLIRPGNLRGKYHDE